MTKGKRAHRITDKQAMDSIVTAADPEAMRADLERTRRDERRRAIRDAS